LGITVASMPQPARSSSATAFDTHTWADGVTMAWSWHLASSGVVNRSMWWTVRIAPRTALAEMQSWAWTTSWSPGSTAAARAAIERITRAPTVSPGTSGRGASRTATAGATGRKKPWSPSRPTAYTVTDAPSEASASASASVCTTPPRGRVE
jgi:hypothetical protein